MPRPLACDHRGRPADARYCVLVGRADAPRSDLIVRTICGPCALSITRPLAGRRAAAAGAASVVPRPIMAERPAFRLPPAARESAAGRATTTGGRPS